MTTLVLATKTLPDPAPGGYKLSYELRGATRVMLDGSTVTDLVSIYLKHLWQLNFIGVTSAQLSDIETAYAATTSAVSFAALDGITYSVKRDPSVKFEAVPEAEAGGKRITYAVTFGLREE